MDVSFFVPDNRGYATSPYPPSIDRNDQIRRHRH